MRVTGSKSNPPPPARGPMFLVNSSPTEQMEEGGQADRPISTARLNTLLCLHRPPINLVVFQGTGRDDSSWRGLRA